MLVVFGLSLLSASSSTAAESAVGLGTAEEYSVLAGTTITDTGSSILSNSLGLSPGSATPGMDPARVMGDFNVANGPALIAKNDLTTAFNDAAGRASSSSTGLVLGTQTLQPGVHTSASSLNVSGAITLDGLTDPNSVFIFQVGSDLDLATGTSIVLINGAQACNVFWQVGGSATLNTGTAFTGSVLALTSVTVNSGTTISGRVLARNGAVTLDNTVFTSADCAPVVTTSPTASASVPASPSASPPVSTAPSVPSTSSSSSPSDSSTPTDGTDEGTNGPGSDETDGDSDDAEDSGDSTTSADLPSASPSGNAELPVPGGSSTSLATTGTDGERIGWLAAAAGLITILGFALVFGGRRRQRLRG